MISIPKVVGVISCGVLLCLGLAGNAALATDDMQAGQSADRKGGQAGHKGDKDKLEGVADESSAKRLGGQAGHKGDDEKLKGVADESSAKRLGGQAGHKGDEEKLQRSPATK